MLAGVQLCIARPTGERTADVVVEFTSIIDSLQNNGSVAQFDAFVFGSFESIIFCKLFRVCLICDTNTGIQLS